MKVNIRGLRDSIEKLNKYLKEYDELNSNYFKEMSKIDDYWRGKDEEEFEKKMNTEKKNVMYISDSLNELSNFYKSAYNHYNRR